ncbi:MAG: thioredoxin family protein [Candidatus Bathyarchaeota archaeon]|nr:thioredoxin family protein [Candidatus Bathyarchaeota archaeon]
MKTSKNQNLPVDKLLESMDRAFVLFYASWCYFSQQFLPIFQHYAKLHPDECLSVIIDDKPELCEKYSIDYYPTVLLFEKGKVIKRLDATPGGGLTEQQLKELTGSA